MRKFAALFMSLVMMSSLVGFSITTVAEEQADAVFIAGTYTGTGEGRNGEIVVSVTFSDTAITDIEVVEQDETPQYAEDTGTLENIPNEIVENQSIAVDTSTGASFTAQGIVDAVEDCIIQAGANPDDFRSEIVKETEDLGDRTENVEVLVIGGGGTGLAAAMSAIDNGADAENVMLVEKMSKYGGSTANSGATVAALGTYYAEEAEIDYDKETWLEEWKEGSENDIGILGVDPGYPTYSRVENYFDQVADAVNWIEDLGVAHWVEYPPFPGQYYQVPDYLIDENGDVDPEGGYMLTDHMVEWLEDAGADMRLNTAGTSLITNDDGDVIGAVVEDENGPYEVYAERGVVLATGGFAASEEMMQEYLPQFADWIDLTTAGAGDTGDGIRMAEEVGGVMYNDPYVITLGSTCLDPTITGFVMSVNLWYRMVVNSDGERIFNEGYLPYQTTVELSRIEDGIAWAIGDSTYFDMEALDAAVDGVEVIKADTIEELAEGMGVDPDTLEAQWERYNEYCESGVDEEFGKDADCLVPISEAPYYAVRIYVCTGGTIDGVKTNEEFQVLREDGSVINGLYAGGETSNREMYAYQYSSGSGVGYALASGHEIGINIMQ